MAKIRLSFYTNIPTPYQHDFFEALSVHFDLTVVYYAKTEIGRQWEISHKNIPYQVRHLKDTIIANWVQKKIKDYHFSWSIIHQVLTDKSDYVILSGAYWIPNTILALFLSRMKGKMIAFLGERLVEPHSEFRKYMKRISLLPLKWNIDRLLAGGKAASKTYCMYGIGIPHSIIPYNININRFDKTNLNSERIKLLESKYKGNNQFLLLSSGSLTQRKNMGSLIRIVKRINKSVNLLIIGDGPDRDILEELIGVDSRIHLAGFVQSDELPYYYAIADVFVFASQYDGWGVVINEAIASGLPIVTSDQVGAAQEWIKDGENGFICRVEDEDGFLQAINKLIEYPNLHKKQALYNWNFRNESSSAHYAEYLHEIIKQDLKR